MGEAMYINLAGTESTDSTVVENDLPPDHCVLFHVTSMIYF